MKRFPAIIPNLIVFLSVCFLAAISGCGKEYSFEVGKSQMASGTWEFVEGNTAYQGNIDSAYIKQGQSVKELHLKGHHASSGQQFHLIIYADTFTAGTYNASAFQAAFDYGSLPAYLYSAGQTTGEFSITITAISKEMISGTFSGQAVKNESDTVAITNGAFKAKFAATPDSPASAGVLGNEAGNCLPMTMSGDYKQGTPLNSTNTIQVQVAVNEPGTYNIFTDPVNGVRFSAEGTFTSRGEQQVILTGSGTPAFGGEQFFVVHYGNSSCGLSISFGETDDESNGYFLTKPGFYWKYEQSGASIIYKVTNDLNNFNGKPFRVIGRVNEPEDDTYTPAFSVRKDGGNYYEVLDVAGYFSDTDPQYIETTFLRDNVPQGASWTSPDFTRTVGGAQVNFNFKYTILEKAVPVSIGPYQFPNVIKVKIELYANGIASGIVEERWYAKNVGLIYMKDLNGTETAIVDYGFY